MHYKLCTIKCALYSVKYTLCTIQCALYPVQYTLYTRALCTIHCALYSVHYTLCTVHHTKPKYNTLTQCITTERGWNRTRNISIVVPSYLKVEVSLNWTNRTIISLQAQTKDLMRSQVDLNWNLFTAFLATVYCVNLECAGIVLVLGGH